jgi:hypothetical protein
LPAAVDGGAPVDAQTAPTAAWKSRPDREISTPPTAIHLLMDHETRSDRPVDRPSRFLRFYVVSNSEHRRVTEQVAHLGERNAALDEP